MVGLPSETASEEGPTPRSRRPPDDAREEKEGYHMPDKNFQQETDEL
jgi:hypothetical protein